MSKSKSHVILAVFLATWLLFTVTFIVLKSLGFLSWSWWWLLVPLLGTPALAVLVVGTVAICAIFLTITTKTNKPL